MKQRGFTLIEVTLVVGIILATTAVVVPNYSKLINTNVLESETSELKAHVRHARELAQSGKYGSNYGVYFQANQYTLYSGKDYANRNKSKDKTFQINDRLELSNYSEVNFQMNTGNPTVTGTLNITNTKNREVKTIKINKLGLIN